MGTTLEMASEPDFIKEHKPYFCTRCGNNLSAIQGSVAEVRQVFDVPMPIFPIVTEHQLIANNAVVDIAAKRIFQRKYIQEFLMAQMYGHW